MLSNIYSNFLRFLKRSHGRSINRRQIIEETFNDMPNYTYDVEQSELLSIKAEIDANPEVYIQKTELLQAADFTLMGKVLQCYCYADLNARRIIDIIRFAEGGPEKQNAGRLADAQVFETLKEATALLEPGNLRDGIAEAANTIAMHVSHRHTFAHWAARRIKGRDVLILWTYNAREAEKRDGKTIEAGQLKYALCPLAPMSTELRKIEGHSEYLAQAVVHLHSQVEHLERHFVAKRESLRAKKFKAGMEKGRMKGERRTCASS